jgi:hypothetical protein
LDNTGGLCSTHGGDEKFITRFWWGDLKGREHAEYLGLDVRIILKRILEKEGGRCGWIHLAQDRDLWRALVNNKVNLRVPQKAGNILTD